MSGVQCPFCDIAAHEEVAANRLAFAIRDKYPVRPLHTLILPRRHVVDVFEATAEEREAIHQLAVQCRIDIVALDASVAGFNFGSNIGAVAGQKVFHAHVHLIPRRANDTPPPPARPDREVNRPSGQ